MPSYRRQESPYAWLVCFSAALSQAVIFGTQYGFGVFFVAFMDNFKESRQKTAWIGSIYFCCSMIATPLVSILNMKMSIRTLGVIGYLSIIIGFLTSAYVKSLDVMFFTYGIVAGLGISFLMLTNNVAIAIYFKENRSIANSLIGVGSSVGNMVTSPVIQSILLQTDLKTCFLVVSGIHLVPCLFSLTFDSNVETKSREDEGAPKKDNSIRENYKLLLKNYGVQIFIFAFALVDTANAVILAFMIKHCDDLGIPPQQGANLLIYYGISAIVGRLLSGLIAQILHVDKIYIMQFGSFYPMGLAAFLIPQMKLFEGLIVLMIILGLSRGVYNSTYNVALYDLCGPALHPYAIGNLSFTTALALFSSPPLASFLADQHGALDAVFYLSGSYATLSGFLYHFIDPRVRARNKEVVDTRMDTMDYLHVVERETVL